MYKNKKLLSVFVSGIGLFLLLFFSGFAGGQVYAKECGDLMEDVEYEEGEPVHPEGDVTLTEDYTLPENTYLNWYGGSLTIASGVTLTIPEDSFLNVSSPGECFTVEEGACIRIEGAPKVNEEEEGNPVCHLLVYASETRIDGTIESENAGLVCMVNKTYLNGTIHAVQQFLMTDQCQVYITGGEYISGKMPMKEVYTDYYESVVEISGGRFTSDKLKGYLKPEYALIKQEDDMYEAVMQVEDIQIEEHAATAGTASEPDSIKEKASRIWEYAKGLFEEAKQDSIQGDGSWVNGDIVVVILCVAVVVISLLLVVIDFIRSPLKKKFKILMELIIAVGVVGGGILFLWNQVQKEQHLQAEEKYADYEKTAVPAAVQLQNDKAELDGLEVYPEGLYLVGKDLEPGTYFFESNDPVYGVDKRPVYYVYSSDMPDFRDKEVGAWIKRSYLELREGRYIRVIGANFIKAGEQPVYAGEEKEGAHIYPAGEYLVGYDIAPGTYQMTIEPYNIMITDRDLDDKKMNFTEYDGINYEGGPVEITLKEGQHLYVPVETVLKLE